MTSDAGVGPTKLMLTMPRGTTGGGSRLVFPTGTLELRVWPLLPWRLAARDGGGGAQLLCGGASHLQGLGQGMCERNCRPGAEDRDRDVPIHKVREGGGVMWRTPPPQPPERPTHTPKTNRTFLETKLIF